MTVKDLKEIVKDLPDNTKVKINSIWNEDMQELTHIECDGFYHKDRKEVYLTPDIISI